MHHRHHCLLAALCLALLPAIAGAADPPDPAQSQLDLASFKRPDYPVESAHAGEEGRVGISVLCGVDGNVTDPQLVEPSGYARLDNAVLAVVPGLRCFPGHDAQTGEAVTGRARFRYNFKLRAPPLPPSHQTTLQLDREETLALMAEARAANPDIAIPAATNQEGYSAAWSMTLEARFSSGAFQPPPYPADALAGRETGTVTAAFLCGRDGTVQRARLIRSSGSVHLDEALLRAFPTGAACQPAHASKNGLPVTSWGMMAYLFAPPEMASADKAAPPPGGN
ncbi:energy transducer TonB [Azospirillum sp. B4]|uniref:energy transducer TonB n=1 Tax=Azospirillum sp. B4 TaxID=95605 RepID=UPI0005CAB244|nr:energy transducer TonB [Azospirillum sp. B4]